MLSNRLNLRKKTALSALSVHMKSVVEQGFSHEFAFDNKALKTFVEFRIWWKRLTFERRQIRIQTSSHPYCFTCKTWEYRKQSLWIHLPMITLHLVCTAKCLGTFLCHLLQRCPSLVQILNLNANLLGSFRLTHCCQTLGNCIQLHQTSLICLQILCCTHCDRLNFRKNWRLHCFTVNRCSIFFMKSKTTSRSLKGEVSKNVSKCRMFGNRDTFVKDFAIYAKLQYTDWVIIFCTSTMKHGH